MSLLTDSPVHSSSSDNFAAFLDAELNSNSSASSPVEEDRDDEDESNDEDAEDDNELEGKRTMDRVRILISYNGRWNELPDGSQRYVGAINKGVYVRKNLTYEELLGVVKAIVKHDPNRYEIDIESISVGPDSTCRTMIADDDDVQFLLGEDKVIPKVCVTLVERRYEELVMGDDIQINQNPLETRQSDNNVVHDSYEAVDLDAPHTVPHFDRDLEPQLDDRFDIGYGPEQHHASGRRVEGEHNISSSNNPTTWVIPGSESFSFGDMSTMGSSTPNTMKFECRDFRDLCIINSRLNSINSRLIAINSRLTGMNQN
ncbi:hypothetical protein Dsin_029250 [Dipteronia sinensis]|uniref:Uncharacterized protein n=1 Tax=Dipteronia sinensis TaxID=43782 RepID=A0AAD9ZSQ3_9ROSI|nr:hypothetical protein Dsin_029250 [Dipteronia sinensis]